MLEITAYVSIHAPGSYRALSLLQDFCSRRLGTEWRLEVVDVSRQPERLLADGVIVTPTVIRRSPQPTLTLIGDLSEPSALEQLVPREDQ